MKKIDLDDSQIVYQTVAKNYALNAGVWIWVRELKTPPADPLFTFDVEDVP